MQKLSCIQESTSVLQRGGSTAFIRRSLKSAAFVPFELGVCRDPIWLFNRMFCRRTHLLQLCLKTHMLGSY